MKKYGVYIVFLCVVVFIMIGKVVELKWVSYAFKPLIIPCLACLFFFYSKKIGLPVKKLMYWGLFFSWLGDISLMLPHVNEMFFITGLVFFLAAQIVYIFLFLKTINLSGRTAFLKKHPYWLIAYFAFGLFMYIILFEQLDIVLRFAIVIYIVAILCMSAMALNRFGNGHPLSFSYVFAGSLLFVASDSLIAINKFLVAIPFEGLFIMGTYMAAQYLIVKGILKQYE